jgi:hypothetical protein
MTDENERDDYDVDDSITEVEVVSESDDGDDSGDDNFSRADDATQKRINRLTKKMREAERQRAEALRYAQQVQNESTTLKSRLNNLDNSYVQEYSTRVSTQMSQAEAALSRAIEMGDTKGSVEAQRTLTALAIQADRAEQAKLQQQRYTQQNAAAQQHQAREPMPAQAPRRPDQKAEKWALRNSWFGQDEAMTYAAFGIHKRLVEDEGFDPQSEDYYTELDRRISSKFRGQVQSTSNRPAQTVAGASRTTASGRSGRKVRLTPSQVAIAKKLGVPLEEYAKHVKD